MVGTGFGIGMDGDGARPQLFRTHTREIDRCFSVHAGRGWHIAIQLIARHHTHAVMFPGSMAVVMTLGWGMRMMFWIAWVVMTHVDYLFLNYLLFN